MMTVNLKRTILYLFIFLFLVSIGSALPDTVALKAYNGQYVCAEGGGGREVVANRDVLGGWETFKLIDLGKNKVALQAYNGQYVSEEGAGPVVAISDSIGKFETFILIDLGKNKVALQVYSQHYVCAEGGGGREVVANRDVIGGWETFELIYISPSKTPIPTTGSISVSSTPSGASIYLDESYRGTTPFNITNVAAGSHTITLKFTGYQDWSGKIDVAAGQTSPVAASLTKIPGSISISSTPSGASIYLDEIYRGTTPFDINNVVTGSHTLILKFTGYQDWSGKINVAAGQTSPVVASLTKIPGSISISSTPSGASIYLDESYRGTTPFRTNVTAGSHTITLELIGYQDWSQKIDVVAGQTSPVTAPLTLIPTTGSISDIIIAIFGISVVIVIFYILRLKYLKSLKAPPEEHSGYDKEGEYPEEEKAAAPLLVGREEEVPVFLAVSAPEVVKPGDIFTARLAAYIKSLEEEVKEELIKLSRGRSESYMGVESCRWKLDTHVTVKLSGKHLKVDPSESEFVWKGERNLANFLVEVLADAPEEWIVLRYEVFIEGIRVAFIPLDLEIKSSIKSSIKSDKKNIVTMEPAHTAFASYASQDRVRVLDRVAAVSISAGLDIFMDCLSIHPGEEWKKRLESEIENRDIFLLFWSANAKNSEWVTWEWKMALVKKEESALQLHPLQTVTEAPPPEELKKFHFGDVHMIVRNYLV